MLRAEPLLLVYPLHRARRGCHRASDRQPGPVSQDGNAVLSPELVQLCDKQLLNEYLYYYYYREVALKAIQNAPENPRRAGARINHDMREELRTVDVKANPEAAFTLWMKHYLPGK